MKQFLSRYQSLITVAFFFAVAALLYLPLATHTGYYDDDWFSMYAGKVAGPQIFRQFYIMDSRPGRALVVVPLYMLFHGVPFYYALSAYVFRALGALSMLWLLRLLWPENKKETFLAALFFLIYPGFLSQPTPIDFQTHLVGIWMAFLSIGLSVKSIFTPNRLQRFLLWGGAVLSGWFYLAQMEYYIRFEIIRVLLFIMIFRRKNIGWKQNVLSTFKSWLPYAVIPVLFLIWRLFLFEGTRKVTDVGLQLGKLTETPIHTSLAWIISLIQDIVNVTLLAWSVPLAQLAFDLDLLSSLIALGLSLAMLALFFYFFPILNKNEEEKLSTSNFGVEALWLGAAWVVFGLLPVVVGNRQVTFLEFSRYGLVSAGGAVIFLAAVIKRLSPQILQRVVIALLLVSATLTHYANTVRFATQMDDIRLFWWQVSWRVPQFEKGTTIVAHYPVAAIREPSFVWGPANQIYYPTRLKPDVINTGISAIRLDRDSVTRILEKDKQYTDPYYMVTAYPNPRHITILTQPTPQSCVQVIDGTAPEYSQYEDPMFLLVGSYSETENILTEGQSPNVPQTLFGFEPDHGWCYYFEKAALARQRGDWNEVLQLADEVTKKSLKPDDLVEWMPFLEAYALNGKTDELVKVLSTIQSDDYVLRQACQKLSALQTNTETQNVIASQVCVPPK